MIPVCIMLAMELPDGTTTQVWPSDPIAEHILLEFQEGDGVLRRRLSEFKRAEDLPPARIGPEEYYDLGEG